MAKIVKRAKGNVAARDRRHARLRKKVSGTAERPRLAVHRSSRHMFVQVIDDVQGKTLASASTMETELRGAEGDKSALARQVGALVAERAKAAGISAVSLGVSTVAALLIWWRSRTVNSPLIRGDAIGSALDALSTLTVLIAFVLGGWLHAQGQEALARYVDPVLTVGLVLVTLPVPYRLGREALSQLLAQSPPAEQRARVEQAIQEGFRDAPVQTLEIKTIKVGRQWDVRIQATLEAQASTLTVSEADGFRRAVQERLATLDEEVQVAVVLRPSGAPHFG